MFRTTVPARRLRRNRLARNFAFSLAVAGMGAAGMTALAAPAHAADKNKQDASEGKPQYTKAFVEAYKPLQDVVNKATDAASAEPGRALVQPMVAAIANDDDRMAGGSILLQLGLKLNDKELQQQGLTMQLDSGKVPADKQAVFNYYVGGMAWDKKDYATASKYLGKAYELGYRENDIDWLVGETYFQQNQNAQGLAALKQMEQADEAAGKSLSEKAMRAALKAAYDAKDTAQIADWAAMVAQHYPRPDIWNIALSVVRDSYDLQPDEALDLYRLMRLTGSLKTKQDYVYYVDSADARKLANEVMPVLQEGISKGLLNASDAYVADNLQVAKTNAPSDRSGADQMAKDARTAANGIAARAAGDNYLAIGEPAKAVEMYQLAAQKGGVEADRTQMRIGVAQAQAGNYDAARQSFQQVTGKRQPVAKMWLAYLASKQAPAAAAAPAAAPAQ
ncbi:MAG TPA: hypothetical protein VF418_04775 [Sphingomonadaceae bacterium]